MWCGVVSVSYRAIHVHTLGGDSEPHQPYKEEAQAERPCSSGIVPSMAVAQL